MLALVFRLHDAATAHALHTAAVVLLVARAARQRSRAAPACQPAGRWPPACDSHRRRPIVPPAGLRPYDLAMARGHRQLLSALNPHIPLSALRQPAAWEPAVPSLAALAAAALRRRLVQQLDELRLAAAAAAATAEAPARPRSRRGSRPGSREGSGHGIGAYASYLAAGAGRLARLSGSAGPQYHQRGLAGGSSRPSHQRHASDSGIGGLLQTWQAPPLALQPGGSAHSGLAACRRAAASCAALCPPSPHPGAAGSSPFGPGLLSLADAPTAAPGSVAGCRTATSVSSVAGGLRGRALFEAKDISRWWLLQDPVSMLTCLLTARLPR